MERRSRATGWLWPIVIAVAAIWSLVDAGHAATQAPAVTNQLALVGGTLFTNPDAAPIRDALVIVKDGAIVSAGRRGPSVVPRGAQVIDCKGLTVMAGFWNSHVHLLQRKWSDAGQLPAAELTRQLQTMLTQYGFTSVFDTWSAWDNTRRIRDRIDAGEVLGPKIRSTGEAMFGPGVSPSVESWAALGFMDLNSFHTARVATPADATAASQALLDRGVDALKFYAATPGRGSSVVSETAMGAGVKEAHRAGKLVFAHPSNVTALMASVRAGVDIIAHTTPETGAWDAVTVTALKDAGIALIPTLKLWTYEFRHERASLADRFVSAAQGQLQAWVKAGGSVLFGTDVGYMSDYDTRDEFVLMSKAGMSFRQILTSLTTAPAARFGVAGQQGQVMAGFAADLTVVHGDPSSDVRSLAAVAYTIRGGRVIFSER